MSLLTTSKEAREILEKLRRTGIRPNLWARAAFGYSLSMKSEPENIHYDSAGTEFLEKVFFGKDEDILMALLRQRYKRMLETNEIGNFIKSHVERGLRLFHQEYLRLNKRGDELLIYLLSLCPNISTSTNEIMDNVSGLLPLVTITGSLGLCLLLGYDKISNEPVEYRLNAPGSSPHIAIMGRNGTGKTRTGLSFLERLTSNAPISLPFLIFDYAKGDISSNSEFVKLTGAKIIKLPDNKIPIAPLSIPNRDTHAYQLAARRFRDTICSVVRLGPIQKDRCLKLIEQLYQNHGADTPDLSDLVNLADQEYSINDWKDDSLTACLHEFSAFPLFQSAIEGEEHDFFKTSYIIDIHRLPEDLRKLSTFLLLDRLYSEIIYFPDAPLDDSGNRQIRLIIVIDEAHHYLPCRQQTLENMVREVRSKGVGIWLFSQSPDDFDQAKYNFAREMGLSIVFSCVLEKPKMLEALLGGKVDPRRLSQLSAGVAITRIPDTDIPVEIKAWQV